MRWIVVSLCVLAAGCSQGLNSPTSPTAAAAVAGASLGQLNVSSNAASLPLRGSFTRASSSTFEPPVTLVISGNATGTSTLLGRFTATSVDRVDTTNNTGVGTFDLTAANGDQILATTVGVENSFVPPNISTVTLAATIVGGTGRFAGATGTFTIQLTEVIDFATNSATGSGTFEGEIKLGH